MDELALRADAMRDRRVFRPLAVEMSLYGVHFADSIFGAEVFDLQGSWQARTLASPVGDLRRPILDDNALWTTARQVAAVLSAAGAAAPFFGLPTIASALNVGINLYGDELLVEMIANPCAVARDLSLINDVLCELHRWYQANLPPAQAQPVVAAYRTQPSGFGQICGCSTHLLSRELYRDLVAPLDEALLAAYPNGGMIHLCGAHSQHIPTWRSMASLRAVQLNDRAAADLALYFEGLREDQILYVNDCDEMPVARIMDITAGRRVVIVADLKEPPKKH
jgi:hypothetical protein